MARSFNLVYEAGPLTAGFSKTGTTWTLLYLKGGDKLFYTPIPDVTIFLQEFAATGLDSYALRYGSGDFLNIQFKLSWDEPFKDNSKINISITKFLSQ